MKIGKDIKLANFIEKEIKEEKSSPEVVEYKIKQGEFSTTLCFKTIYNYIDKEILEIERKDLVYGNYEKKNKSKKEESEYLKPNKEGKTIHDRPKEIETRIEVGHWEMDLVEGLKGQKEPYLLVLSERKTSYTKSKKARTSQYFADAYCSWQRGTNENINKMIRRFLPKGTSFKDLTQEEVKRIEKWINNYPRKILKFKISEEYYEEQIKVA